MIKRIGFTGTRKGMTELQEARLETLLFIRSVNGAWFHHGDCIGADAQAHTVALMTGHQICLHPPINPKYRAQCQPAHMVREEGEYMDRDHQIVDETHELIACPQGREVLRSGTWATVRYARKIGKPLTIIMPDGSWWKENA